MLTARRPGSQAPQRKGDGLPCGGLWARAVAFSRVSWMAGHRGPWVCVGIGQAAGVHTGLPSGQSGLLDPVPLGEASVRGPAVPRLRAPRRLRVHHARPLGAVSVRPGVCTPGFCRPLGACF